MSEINADTPKEPLFHAEERLLFTGKELETILHEVVGTASVVFMKDQPDLIMPATELYEAVGDFVERSPDTWKKAIDAAPPKGPSLGFDFKAVKPPGVVALTDYLASYQGDPAVEHAHTVIDHRGDVIKDPDGRTGRRVTDQERAEALVTFPQKRYISSDVPERMMTTGDGIFERKAAECRLAASMHTDAIAVEGFIEAADWFERQARGEDPEGPYESKTIILMAPETYYHQHVLADAAVVIDRDGVIFKNREGIAGVEAEPELLEKATPVFPDDSGPEARRKGREFHDEARRMTREGYVGGRKSPLTSPHPDIDPKLAKVWDLPKESWTPIQKLALTLSSIGLVLSITALVVTLLA